MSQFYYAGRVYGDISYRQPLTPDQVKQFILQTGETDDMEIYYVMNGCFVAPYFQPGVIFVENQHQNSGQLFIKLKDSDTFWSMGKTFHTDCADKVASLLKFSNVLAKQIRNCMPISSHNDYRQKVGVLMEIMGVRDGRWIDIRQVEFIKLERQSGTYEQNMAIGAVA